MPDQRQLTGLAYRWAPIASAPKLGWLLLRIPRFLDDPTGRPVVGSWSAHEKCWRDISVSPISAIFPTQWAPIPPFDPNEAADD